MNQRPDPIMQQSILRAQQEAHNNALLQMAENISKEKPVDSLIIPPTGGVAVKGMRKRELFAAMAMQGLLASNGDGEIVKQSVLFADALLAELERTNPFRTPEPQPEQENSECPA